MPPFHCSVSSFEPGTFRVREPRHEHVRDGSKHEMILGAERARGANGEHAKSLVLIGDECPNEESITHEGGGRNGERKLDALTHTRPRVKTADAALARRRTG